MTPTAYTRASRRRRGAPCMSHRVTRSRRMTRPKPRKHARAHTNQSRRRLLSSTLPTLQLDHGEDFICIHGGCVCARSHVGPSPTRHRPPRGEAYLLSGWAAPRYRGTPLRQRWCTYFNHGTQHDLRSPPMLLALQKTFINYKVCKYVSTGACRMSEP